MSQKEHYKKAKSRLNKLQTQMQTNIEAVEKELDWYDKQLTEFKSIEPGCDNTTNLKRRLEAWRSIVPNCDTPQKLAKYVRKLEDSLGVEQPVKPLEEGLKYTEYWNQYFVPYCQEKDIPVLTFTEARFIQERSIFLEEMRAYGESDDPCMFLDFFRFLKERDIAIPYDMEAYL